jgi:hypothetical protein
VKITIYAFRSNTKHMMGRGNKKGAKKEEK